MARSNPAAAREDAAGGVGLGSREEKPSRRGPEAGWVRSPEIAQMGFLGSVFGSELFVRTSFLLRALSFFWLKVNSIKEPHKGGRKYRQDYKPRRKLRSARRQDNHKERQKRQSSEHNTVQKDPKETEY